MTSCGGMKRVMKTLSFCLEDVCTQLRHKHWCANMMQGNFLLTNEHIRNQFVAPCGRGEVDIYWHCSVDNATCPDCYLKHGGRFEKNSGVFL